MFLSIGQTKFLQNLFIYAQLVFNSAWVYLFLQPRFLMTEKKVSIKDFFIFCAVRSILSEHRSSLLRCGIHFVSKFLHLWVKDIYKKNFKVGSGEREC